MYMIFFVSAVVFLGLILTSSTPCLFSDNSGSGLCPEFIQLTGMGHRQGHDLFASE